MFSKNITVLYPVLHYPPVIGGLEQWCFNIAQNQPENVKIIIVTGRVNGVPDFEKKGNVTIYRTSFFPLKDLSHSSFLYILTTVPFIFFRSFALRRNVHVFHCHGFMSACIGYFLSLGTTKPFLCTEQSMKTRNSVSKLLSRIVYGKAVTCIASSNAVADEFKKIGAKRIEIVPNGVEAEKFSKCERCGGSDPPHTLTILSVGRLEKVKGHTYLIDAFAQIKKEIPGATLTFVGDGSERARLEKQVKDLGVQNDVTFVGEIPHDELPQWYHKADVFVMPSLSEGFGICAIEAMAAGLPVIATKVGSLPEIVLDGQTGVLVGAGRPEEIARAVLRICADKDLAARLSLNGKKRAAEFDWRKSAEKVYDIYRSLA